MHSFVIFIGCIAQAFCNDSDWIFEQNFGTDIPADWISFRGMTIQL